RERNRNTVMAATTAVLAVTSQSTARVVTADNHNPVRATTAQARTATAHREAQVSTVAKRIIIPVAISNHNTDKADKAMARDRATTSNQARDLTAAIISKVRV